MGAGEGAGTRAREGERAGPRAGEGEGERAGPEEVNDQNLQLLCTLKSLRVVGKLKSLCVFFLGQDPEVAIDTGMQALLRIT